MKMFTKIAAVVALSSFMFAGMSITWGNNYSENTTGDLTSEADFGVWFDMNDATSIGWDGGLKVGLAGPAGMTFRLGYDAVTTLGVGRSWWSIVCEARAPRSLRTHLAIFVCTNKTQR